MRWNRLLVVFAVLFGVTEASAAENKTYKYDQFKENIEEAVAQVGGMSLAVQSGYSAGEAFGILITPAPNEYPVKILGLDILFAAPPNGGVSSAKADVEVWTQTDAAADPGAAEPVFTISTDEFYNSWTGGFGVPLEGDKAFRIDFDWEDPNAHPPIITQGNFRVVIRFKDAPQDLSDEWGVMQCGQMPELGMCGCQTVGTLHDQASTPGVNVVHLIDPLGSCSGGRAWHFANELGISGDYIMRVRANVASTACTANCTNKECGSDGCGGSCGTCGEGESCSAGVCGPACAPECTGKECGDDGCGSTCGTCPNAAPNCVEGICQAECTPDCTDKECGDDGCGSTCGTCPGAAPVCDDTFKCVKACEPACDGKECGDDGCGSTCGTCPAAVPYCQEGLCVDQPVCEPACSGKQCGDDGCGSVCGTCESGLLCVEGVCQEGTVDVDVLVTAISPDWGYNDAETAVSITGSGFKAGASVKLGAANLSQVVVVSPELITAVVPSSMAEGAYMLVIVNSDGSTGSLEDAFEVRLPEGGASSGSCAMMPEAGAAGLAVLAALMLAALLWARRIRG